MDFPISRQTRQLWLGMQSLLQQIRLQLLKDRIQLDSIDEHHIESSCSGNTDSCRMFWNLKDELLWLPCCSDAESKITTKSENISYSDFYYLDSPGISIDKLVIAISFYIVQQPCHCRQWASIMCCYKKLCRQTGSIGLKSWKRNLWQEICKCILNRMNRIVSLTALIKSCGYWDSKICVV